MDTFGNISYISNYRPRFNILILFVTSAFLGATAYVNKPCMGFEKTDVIHIPNKFIQDMKISPIVDNENFIRLNVTFLSSKEFRNGTATILVHSKDTRARCNKYKEHLFSLEEKQFLVPRYDFPAEEDEIKEQCEYIIDLNIGRHCIILNESFIVPSNLKMYEIKAPGKSTDCNVLGKIENVTLQQNQTLKVDWAFDSNTTNLTSIIYHMRTNDTISFHELNNAYTALDQNYSLVPFKYFKNNTKYELIGKFIGKDCDSLSSVEFFFPEEEERVGSAEEYYENSNYTVHIIYFLIFVLALSIIVGLIVTKTKSAATTSSQLTSSPPTYNLPQDLTSTIIPSHAEKTAYIIVSNTDVEEFKELEINPRTVTVGDKLGGGAFGNVFYGEVPSIKEKDYLSRDVAIKIPNDSSSHTKESLLEEIRTMQTIGTHPNIVKLLGCCTKERPYMIIMELVDEGKSLKDYLNELRGRWEITKNDSHSNYEKMNWGSFGGTVWHRPASQYRASPKDEVYCEMKNILDSRELKNFALQIARGMEHLERLKVVHRDLAARNILMTSNKVLKISDFGMSKTEAYFSYNPYKQPARWMALESLTSRFFNTKTDVWSYGVVLWEIGTLGALPYKEVEDKFLILYLSQGTRLGKPQICTNEMYVLMQKCWLENPNHRPTFKQLVKELDVEPSKVYVINKVQEITPPSMLFQDGGSVDISYDSE